jgi:hypothetical protein
MSIIEGSRCISIHRQANHEQLLRSLQPHRAFVVHFKRSAYVLRTCRDHSHQIVRHIGIITQADTA